MTKLLLVSCIALVACTPEKHEYFDERELAIMAYYDTIGAQLDTLSAGLCLLAQSGDSARPPIVAGFECTETKQENLQFLYPKLFGDSVVVGISL